MKSCLSKLPRSASPLVSLMLEQAWRDAALCFLLWICDGRTIKYSLFSVVPSQQLWQEPHEPSSLLSYTRLRCMHIVVSVGQQVQQKPHQSAGRNRIQCCNDIEVFCVICRDPMILALHKLEPWLWIVLPELWKLHCSRKNGSRTGTTETVAGSGATTTGGKAAAGPPELSVNNISSIVEVSQKESKRYLRHCF